MPAIDQPICFPIVMDTPTIYRQEGLAALGGQKHRSLAVAAH
jgi:hypothetical protein